MPPASKKTLEIKNIDPIAKKEELVEDISTELDIKDERWITVKSLRMTPWGTQQMLVLVPATDDRQIIRIRTGLTIATARILPNIIRYFKCHMLGHNAARYTR